MQNYHYYYSITVLSRLKKKNYLLQFAPQIILWLWCFEVYLPFIAEQLSFEANPNVCFPVSQVVVSPNEPASTVIIEFDTNNSIFGLPRQFVVASAGKHDLLVLVDDFTRDTYILRSQ